MLCLTMDNQEVLPRNFRMVTDPYYFPFLTRHFPTRLGLDNLKASGSAQFSEKSLQKLLKTLPISNHHLIIIDLREESHGFINGIAVTWRDEKDWGNINKNDQEIFEDENNRLDAIFQNQTVIIQNNKDDINAANTTTLQVTKVQSESDLMTAYGVDYYRLTITDHIRPPDQDVDTFIKFVHNLPENTWLHFHCAAGKGRTSTFLTMYDMMHNAKKVSLEDIFERQALIGGKNFNDQPDPYIWKYSLSSDRIQFLRDFYRYCQEKEDSTLSWSEWKLYTS